MSEEITPDIFHKLASLASLELDEAESEYLRAQLNKQLQAVHELQNIPLDDDIPPASHGVPFPREISPALRPDRAETFPNADDILKGTPESSDRYIVVPDTRHTSLE